MREKYIEERHPRWFSMTAGGCDLSDSERIGFALAGTSEDALKLTEEHDKLLDAFIALAQAWDEADHSGFADYWYGRAT